MKKSKINILFLSHSGEWAGAEKMLYLTLKVLDKELYRPIVICNGEGTLVKKLKEQQIETIVKHYTWWIGLHDYQTRKSYVTHLGTVVSELAQTIKERNIDLVFTNTVFMPYGALAASISEVPHLWHVHEFVQRNTYMGSAVDKGEALALMGELSNQVVTVSNAVKSELMDNEVPKSKIKVIYNAIQEYENNRKKKPLNKESKEENWIACITSIEKRKGVLDLAIAVNSLKKKGRKVRLILKAGKIYQKKYYENTVNAISSDGLKVISNEFSVEDVLESADMVVVPSHSEAFGLVILEAMAKKKPVIASRAGGPEEIIKHKETGYLVAPHKPDEIERALEFMLDQPEDAKQMGLAGYKEYKNKFTVDQYSNAINDQIARVVGDCNEASGIKKRTAETYLKKQALLKPLIYFWKGRIYNRINKYLLKKKAAYCGKG